MADADVVFSALPRADVSPRPGLFHIMSGGAVAVTVNRSATTVAAVFAGVLLESTAAALPAGCSRVFDETGGSGMPEARPSLRSEWTSPLYLRDATHGGHEQARRFQSSRLRTCRKPPQN